MCRGGNTGRAPRVDLTGPWLSLSYAQPRRASPQPRPPDPFTSNEQTAYVHSWTRAFANAVARHEALIRRGGERRPGWTNPARYLLPATDVDALNRRDRAPAHRCASTHTRTASGPHGLQTQTPPFPQQSLARRRVATAQKARTNPSEPFRRYAEALNDYLRRHAA